MVSFRSNLGLVSYFKEVCNANSGLPAVVSDSRSLTFSDIDALSDRVAAHLASKDIGQGDFVGLLMGRSVDAMIALLGVVKTGAAYVPLDPTYAPEQLPLIVQDVPLTTCLVAKEYSALIASLKLPSCDPIEEVLLRIPEQSFTPFNATGDNAACVLYTSGTTGQPKGVVVPQRAIAAYVLGLPLRQLDTDDVVLHSATIACDGALFEIWGSLLTGARTAVVEKPAPSLSDIGHVMQKHRVSAILWYAGLHHLMIDHQIEAFETVTLNMAGGDVMSPKHAEKLLSAWPNLRLCNVYGPTETAIDSLWYEVTLENLTDQAIPIGVPFKNEDAFVVDDNLTPLATGSSGQLAISGPGVALGYYDQPEVSAKVFVADPRPGKSGRIYLTGDVAHQNKDGIFEFKGRVDRQIKLGGRRIELDGVEHTLRQLEAVSEAAVFLVDTASGGKAIAAVLRPAKPVSDEQIWIGDVLRDAAKTLNSGALPKHVEITDTMPLTGAGKIDRKALKTSFEADKTSNETTHSPAAATDLKAGILAVWDKILGCGPVSEDKTFFDAGGTSLQLFQAHAEIEALLGQPLDITLLFETPQLGALARQLAELKPVGALPQQKQQTIGSSDQDIAIVGLSGRFPGAGSIDEFYEKLQNGENLIPHFAQEDLEDNFSKEDRNSPDFVAARPILDNADQFDSKFFNILPREADQMDPQARVFLEICVEALNNAGIDPKRTADAIGVFAGTSMSTYMLSNLMADRAALDDFTTNFQIGNYATLTGNVADSLSTRVAYKLDLKGPAITMGTACSTSLTAISQACMNLRSGQTDAALAGGVSITFPQKRGYMSLEGGMGSRDGVCRPFDADANGTVFGHGAGVVVLKRLADAQAAGDTIYAVIRGIGLNNDGADKIAYTAPSVAGQAAAIELAHRDAGISSGSVSYVECHGTATPLGDPIEIKGLSQAFGNVPAENCAIGSVKGNIGHLDAASGVVSVIKTALMLHRKELLPIANFKKANPNIDFSATPFFVPENSQPWVSKGPRRAGISSFGVGGTNAHLLLEEAPALAEASDALEASTQIITLSAKAPEALAEMAGNLSNALAQSPEHSLSDIAYTLQEGRTEYPYRLAVPTRNTETVSRALTLAAKTAAKTRPASEDVPPIVFMFPGQGSQYPGMGKDLYHSEPEFARWIDKGVEILQPILELNINEILCLSDVSDDKSALALKDTRLTQPALYLTQFACAKLWQSRGICPDAMIGHSVGEFTAAALAGVFSFEDGLRIIASRGQLMQDQPSGSMLSVRTDNETILRYLSSDVDLAAQNAPKLQVLAGPDAVINDVASQLEKDGIANTKLHTSHAFHSLMMDPVLEPLEEIIASCELGAPQIPYVSCVTGDWITEAEARDPSYWAFQARAAVNFQTAVKAVSGTRSPVLLEVGAGRTLSAFAAQTLERGSHSGIFQSLPDHTRSLDDVESMAAAFGNLWAAGVPVDWERFGPRGNRRVPLPGYAFQRRRHWIDPPAAIASGASTSQVAIPIENDEVPADMATDLDRSDRLLNEVISLFSDLSGEELTTNEADAAYLELGFDSLFLGQVSQAVNRNYGVDISFRSLLTEFPNMSALAGKLDQELPADTQLEAQEPASAPVRQDPDSIRTASHVLPALTSAEVSDPVFIALAEAQLQTMQSVFAQQVQALRESKAAVAPAKLQNPVSPGIEENNTPAPTRNIPLTANQRELWVTSQMGDLASCCFNQSASISLTGDLQIHALETALTRLIARHDGLRMVFSDDGETFDVADPFPCHLEQADVSDEVDPDTALVTINKQLSRQVFDIAAAPSVRTVLVKMSADEHVLIFNTHHIVCDGWSYNIVFDELAKLYTAEVTGEPATLPAANSFARFAQEQAKRNPRQQTQQFWSEQFLTAPEVLDLPADAPRPEHRSYEAGYHSAFVDAEAADAIRQAGARNGCTLFATLFAGLQVTLGRLGAENDVVIGIPTAGQTLLENTCLIGHYVNFLPIRAPLAENQTVSGHLAAAQNALLNAFDHKDYTYGSLVADLGLQSTPGRVPLTEVELNLEKEAEVYHMVGLKVGTIFNPKPATNFDMFINVTEIGQRLRIDVTYNSEIYRDARIASWMESFESVLAQFGSSPDKCLEQLDVPAAKTDAPFQYPNIDFTVPVTALVDRQVETLPDKTAVVCGQDQSTYSDLDARSDAIAAYLQRILPDQTGRVAVALPRSVDMLATILGILKSGNAFVPLDPRQPVARLASILKSAQVHALVTGDPALAEGVNIPGLKSVDPALVETGETPNTRVIQPEDTAYVIFTSGTTGTPKGVEVSHSALSNFLQSMAVRPGFTANDILLSVTTVMFDISILELFLPLISGGSVEIARTEDVLDGFALAERIDRGDISVMQATPTLWSLLLETGLKPRKGMKLLAGGEPLPVDLAAQLSENGASVWNMYGPTETTIWSTLKELNPNSPITAGHPIANTDLLILDSSGAPVASGENGELFITGTGLAKGYFNQEDLTEAAFRAVTIKGPVTRAYGTGDLARQLSNGELEVLGRLDSQVKLRGFRIELGDIETKLRSLPSVNKAAVALWQPPHGDKQLAAYVVLKPGHSFDRNETIVALANQLPDYMVPHTYVELSTLPQTANGKLDRKSLPDPDAKATVSHFPAPSSTNPIESTKQFEERISLKLEQATGTDNLRRAFVTYDAEGLKEGFLAHQFVQEAAVLNSGKGYKAYVVPDPNCFLPFEQLEKSLTSYAKDQVSPQMGVSVTMLAGLPKNASGFVDVTRLPQPKMVKPITSRSGPELGDITRELVAIWQELLGITHVPTDTRFFDLGGHSLAAVRLVARVRKIWDIKVNVTAIYQHQTVDQLAQFIESHFDQPSPATADDWRIETLHAEGTGIPVIGVNDLGIILSTAQHFEEERPAICVRLFDGTRGIDQSDRSFEEIALEYANVIKEAQPQGPYLLFGVCVHGNIALEAARHLQAQGETIAGVVMKDTWEPGYALEVRNAWYTRTREKFFSLGNRIRMVHKKQMSVTALLGSYGVVRKTGILQMAQKLRFIDRVRATDLTAEQEGFIDYISEARNVYRPKPLDVPVLHVVSYITPQANWFLQSVGWERVLTNLKTVNIEDVSVYGGNEIGTQELARTIEKFLGNNEL